MTSSARLVEVLLKKRWQHAATAWTRVDVKGQSKYRESREALNREIRERGLVKPQSAAAATSAAATAGSYPHEEKYKVELQ